MEKQTERYRDYLMDDAVLCSKARTQRALFLKYIAQFTAFDPFLDNTFEANWLSQIEDCERHPTDETVVDQQQQYTSDMEEAKTNAFTATDDLEYYVNKAFEGKKRTILEFGFNKRNSLRSNVPNLYVWLLILKKVAADYTAELTTVGMPATVITTLETRTALLLEKETDQEYYKRLRLRHTTQRMDKYNALYKLCKHVNKAAEVIFYEQPEERGMFEI